MNPAVALLRLRQGDRSIDDDVVEFCEISCQVDLYDLALKDIFRHGLNYLMNYLMPDNTPHWTLAKHNDCALLLSGSSFTVGVVDTGPLNPTLSTTPESRLITSAMAATPEFPDVMAVLSLPHTLLLEAATSTAPSGVAVTTCELSPMLRPRRLFPNSLPALLWPRRSSTN
jgi:hypothetical protein